MGGTLAAIAAILLSAGTGAVAPALAPAGDGTPGPAPTARSASAAPAAAGTLPGGTEIKLPCAPPLDTELRYSRTQVEESAKGRKVNSIDIKVRFRREGGGYRMWTKIELPGAPAALLAQAPVRILVQPIEFRVSEAGEISGLVDEPGYWRGVDSIMDSYAKLIAPEARERQVLLGLYEGMRRLPDETRIGMIARNVAPILSFCGLEGDIGDVWTAGREEVSLPIAGLPKLVREQQITFVGATDTEAYLQVTTGFDKAAFKRVIEALMAMGPDKDGRPARSQSIPEVSQSVDATVARATGLTVSYVERSAAGPDAGTGEAGSKTLTLQLRP
jgi:hypothetical protein